MSSVVAGRLGEEAAIEFLQKKGYKILAKNFRSKFGEIDIVALRLRSGSLALRLRSGSLALRHAQGKDNVDVLVFVEVKTRWSNEFGYPEEAVTPLKIRSIIKTGDYFKLLNKNTPDLVRIDVIAIEVEGERVVGIRHIENVTG